MGTRTQVNEWHLSRDNILPQQMIPSHTPKIVPKRWPLVFIPSAENTQTMTEPMTASTEPTTFLESRVAVGDKEMLY